VSEQSLPSGSVVRFREPTLWDTYKWHIIGGLALCVVEALLIAGLLIQLVKRWRADARFRQVIETAPTGMLIMVGPDGTIVMVNAQVEKVFGYDKDELLGRAIEVLVPDYAQGRHPADRGGIFAEPVTHSIVLRHELCGRRKNGSDFPVEIGLSPLRTARGLFVLASVTNVTERRRAEDELRASQKELKLLTARLLEAQEIERRRVARELHDDVSQSLALLSMEMELLAAAPPKSAAETADRVRALSAQVKELTTSVHDLSHQLHPMKLEQLGLAAAVRGLCKDVSQRHRLDVKFTHYPEPGVILRDTALCLYRIVQEALQNVVKHSGSRHAAVELWGTAGAICLRVVDDGIGFDPSAVSCHSGLGLVGMRERLHLIGGEIAIDSRASGGTRIEVRVPVPATGEAEDAMELEAARG
jgi:PAS domain S-box-containing protein